MGSSNYHIVTHWRVMGTTEEVFDIIQDPLGLPYWWPSVYLSVHEMTPGDERGVGRTIDLHTKGWLPYTLRWQFRVTEVERPRRLALEAFGDFSGRGVWTFGQDGPWVDISYDWNVEAHKLLLRNFSFLLRPIFLANHRWAMNQGEKSLRLELARRRATTPFAHSRIPSPPGPTSARPLVAAGALLAFMLLLAGRVTRKRRD